MLLLLLAYTICDVYSLNISGVSLVVHDVYIYVSFVGRIAACVPQWISDCILKKPISRTKLAEGSLDKED